MTGWRAGPGQTTFVEQAGSLRGDRITGFHAGDLIRFEGFGPDARLRDLGDGHYRVVDGAGHREAFTVEGVEHLVAGVRLPVRVTAARHGREGILPQAPHLFSEVGIRRAANANSVKKKGGAWGGNTFPSPTFGAGWFPPPASPPISRPMQTKFTPEQLADPDTRESNRILRTCVHCGFCTATCPTFVLLGDELDSPRGRIYLIKDMLESGRPATEEVVRHVDRCLSCLSCMTTCPSGVNYMHLVDHARQYIEETYDRPWHEKALRRLLARCCPIPRRFRLALAGAAAGRPFAGLIPGEHGRPAAARDADAGAAQLPPRRHDAGAAGAPGRGRTAAAGSRC